MTNRQNNDKIHFAKFNDIEWSFFDATVISALTLFFVVINFFIPRINPTSICYPIYYIRGEIVLLLIFISFKLKKSTKINRYSLGLSTKLSRDAKTFLIVFSLVASIIIALFLLLTLKNVSFDSLYQKSVPFHLQEAIYQKNTAKIFFYITPHVISVLIFAPLLEEILYTGIIYSAIRNKLSIFLALIITGLIFALGHDVGNISHFSKTAIIKFMIVFFSELLSFFLYQYTRSLYPSILYHFVRNLFVSLPLFNVIIRMMVLKS